LQLINSDRTSKKGPEQFAPALDVVPACPDQNVNAAMKKMRRAAEPDGEAKIPPARLVDSPNRLPGPVIPWDPVVGTKVGATLPDGVP